jgi:hypothetical protein
VTFVHGLAHFLLQSRPEVVLKRNPDGKPVWTTINVLRLVKYVPLADVEKLRCCYLAAKRDPSVFVFDDGTNSRCPPPPPSSRNGMQQQESHCRGQIDTICSWKPAAVLEKYRESPTDKQNQVMFFKHITNFVATRKFGNDMKLVPSAYLDIEINEAQIEMLKPTHKNVVMGTILNDSDGKGAYQLIAKRRIDMIDGNIGSYSRLLNSTARMEMIREVNALAATRLGY